MANSDIYELSFVLNNSPIAHGLYHLDGRILYINKAFETLFGYEFSEIPTIKAWKEKAYPTPEYAKQMEAVWQADVEECIKSKTQSHKRMYIIKAANGQALSIEISFSINNNLLIAAFIDCTQRASSERLLQQNEKLLWAVFNQTYQFMGLLLPDGRLARVNDSALAIINKKEHEVIGQYFWDCPWWTHSATEQERLKDAIHRAAQNESVRMETSHPDAQGNIHTVLFSIKPVYGIDGELLYLLPEGTDISEIRTANKQLQISEERMRIAFEASMEGILDKNLITNETYFSNRWLKILEYDDENTEMSLALWHSSVHPDDYEATMLTMKKAIENGQNFETQYRIKTKHGFWKHILARGIISRNDANQATRLIAVSSDITQLLHSKLALEKSEQQLQTAQHLAKIGSWEANFTDNTMSCSEEAFRIFGYEPYSVEPSFAIISENTHPDDRKDLHNAFWNALIQKTNFHFTYRIITPAGEVRYVQSQARNEFAPNGTPIRAIGTSQDVTELQLYRQNLELLVKQRTEELQQVNEELRSTNEILYDQKHELEAALQQLHEAQNRLVQSEKMASLGILTAGIAHEINNPLNYIKSGVEAFNVLKESLIESVENCISQPKQCTIDKAHQHCFSTEDFIKLNTKFALCSKNINIGVDKIVSIIKSLRMFSRMDNDEIVKNNVHDTIGSALIILQNKHKNRIKIHTEFSDIPSIETYGEQLFQVIINLLANAIDAIENEGRISIGTKLYDTKYIAITIADTGMGMSNETLARLFEPFYTTKKMGVGTGLGLAISYGMVQRHGGRIEVESQLGKGSVFTIIMPIHLNS